MADKIRIEPAGAAKDEVVNEIAKLLEAADQKMKEHGITTLILGHGSWKGLVK